MSGVAFTTISPSRTNSSRNTPWVDGCCGPIEIVICVSRGRSTISNCGGMFTVVLITQDCHRDTEKLQIKSLGRWYVEVNSLCVILFVSLCLCGELFQAIRLVAP